ncbi:ABC transporter substrate-binding protein [Paenibacillus rhizovicinus]|uniref:ABC transporter substrate-binding protein n=1 Tax=Paenibacillus rhizovicinus TaxID=2704463 RepID=A0A6C0P1V7_9BACL|nr:ABC transporter substrate-binding protein [Paenibacillus rhizovicinus]QHW32468.1 ABC transporter substrate-binding protein [Paenibacillus rhizovicinus]
MNKRNRYLLIPAALLSIAAISACGTNSSKDADIALRVAYNQWVGSAGLFIADSKGYFKDAGIDVKLIEFASPTEATQALLSDNVDIALTTLDTAVMVKSNEASKNLKVFSLTDLSSGADGIVADKDIKTIADLKGKTVAATIGAVNHFLLDHALKQAGLSESDVKLSNVAPEQTGPLFMSGKVDAAVTWEPYLSQSMAKGGNLLFSTKEAPDLIIDGMVASENLIQDHGSEIRKLVDAIDKGTQFYYSDTDEAATIVGEKLDASKDDVKSMMDGVKLIPQSEVKLKMTDGLSSLEQHAQDFSSFFLDKKLIKNDIKAPDLFDNFLYQ